MIHFYEIKSKSERLVFVILFFLPLFFSSLLLASEKKSSGEGHMQVLVEGQESSFLMNSKEFKECKSQHGDDKNAITDCMNEILKDLSADDLKKLVKERKGSAAVFKQSRVGKELREYLTQRLREGLYGQDYMKSKNLKDMKFVNQMDYFRLFKTQLSKNVIMEVSRYCMENVGVKDNPESLALYQSFDQEKKEAKVTQYDKVVSVDSGSLNVTPQEPTAKDTQVNFSNLYEFDVCDTLTSESGNRCQWKASGENNIRSVDMITHLKDLEFKLISEGKLNADMRFKVCAAQVLPFMCRRYECKNKGAKNDEEKKECEERYGVGDVKLSTEKEISAELDASNIKLKNQDLEVGMIACSVVERLRGYRNSIKAIEEQTKKMGEDLSDVGYDTSVAFSGVYGQGGKGEKSLDQLTSVSSTEVSQEVKSLKSDQEAQDELMERCFDKDNPDEFIGDGDEECMALVTHQKTDASENVLLEHELQTKVKLELLNKLSEEEMKEEDLKQYLLDNGLGEYVDKIGEMDQSDLIKLIQGKYSKEREEHLKRMKFKIRKLKGGVVEEEDEQVVQSGDKKKKPQDQSQEEEPDAAKMAKINLKKKEAMQKRVKGLIGYANIVSSYLLIDDGEGESGEKIEMNEQNGGSSGRRNLGALQLEKDAFDQYKSKEGVDVDALEKEEESLQVFFNDLEDEGPGTGNNNTELTIDASTIDKMTGDYKKEKEENEEGQ